MSYNDRMAAILIADHERYIARMASEGTPADTYYVDRQITGEPTDRNRTYRASDDCWKRGLRMTHTVGIAPGTDVGDGTATVLVTRADGTSEIRSAHSFRKEHIAVQQKKHRVTVAQDNATRYNDMVERFGAIGNIE